jgi:hypothetical protein
VLSVAGDCAVLATPIPDLGRYVGGAFTPTSDCCRFSVRTGYAVGTARPRLEAR